jgi:hypothetical protein
MRNSDLPKTITVEEVIEAWGLDCLLGEALRHIARVARSKDPLRDIKKAMWYLERAISRIKSSN